MKKKIDSRIRTLIENGVKENHRSFFVIVGDKGRDQVVNLHYILTKAAVKQRPNVLWCYKKELGFSSHRQKRMKQIKKMVQRGLLDPNKDDPFELFISSTDIRYTYYKETHKILGNTYGMCILQDFEALTPNLLARTIETVEGGGIVVLLLRTMQSLKQLYTMAMDVHSRYRTEAHQDVVARFNERFLLSLTQCDNCLIVDDELNVLPISAKAKGIVPVASKDPNEPLSESDVELSELKKSLADTQPVGSLIKNAKTLDQAKSILTFIEAISEKTLRTTVALTASRGRGKSAALGLAISGAVAFGYSNIFVTSPSPENLKTLFEFIFKGFDALGYEEHLDYDIVQSTNPAFNKAVVRVNIFREHRQTIQYIQPQDAQVLGQAELVVIDEAAAIPLPYVKALLGPYLVFLASTVNGYEGTGRSLSLKLIHQLRESSLGISSEKQTEKKDEGVKKSATGRVLREIKLEEPIRYAVNDSVESWLNQLLCLDATLVPKATVGCPHPSECELFYVNRDTLFSYHKAAEQFLQRMVSIYVASHYKNSPNDLQLLSDAPSHHIFVLLPPVDETSNSLPEILAVVQIALEGEISKQTILSGLGSGDRASGDLIPWTIAQQFQDENFGALSGGRIVRIATHPDYQKMGYGMRCLDLLKNYYEGNIVSLQEDDEMDYKPTDLHEEAAPGLLNENIGPRKNLPPLLVKLNERKAEHLDYLGVSYGLTDVLHRFWKKAGYIPVYLRQTSNELTGEHTCIMLKALSPKADHVISVLPNWLNQYWTDFERRFINLLSYQFRNFSAQLALEILNNKIANQVKRSNSLNKTELLKTFTVYDLKRLESYANNTIDYHLILDMLPTMSFHYFLHRLDSSAKGNNPNDDDSSSKADDQQAGGKLHLSPVQQTILAGLGLQRKSVDDLEKELGLPSSQILALFNKTVRKITAVYHSLQESAIEFEEKPKKGAKKDSKAEKKKTREEEEQKEEENDEGEEEAEEQDNDEEAGNKGDKKRDLKNSEEWEPLGETLEEDLEDAGNNIKKQLKEQQRKLLDSLNLQQYRVAGNDEDWEKAVKSGTIPTSVSIKNPNSSKVLLHKKRSQAAGDAKGQSKPKKSKTKH